MNWKRIFIFVGIFFGAAGLAAFPSGFTSGYSAATSGQVPAWTVPAEALAVPFATILVFGILAWVQRTEVLAHCLLVLLFGWLLLFLLNVFLLQQPLRHCVVETAVLIVAAGIGAGAGIGLRRLSLSGQKDPNVDSTATKDE